MTGQLNASNFCQFVIRSTAAVCGYHAVCCRVADCCVMCCAGRVCGIGSDPDSMDISETHILRTQFTEWYDAYKQHTIPSVASELSQEFITFLHSDGVYVPDRLLPKHATAASGEWTDDADDAEWAALKAKNAPKRTDRKDRKDQTGQTDQKSAGSEDDDSGEDEPTNDFDEKVSNSDHRSPQRLLLLGMLLCCMLCLADGISIDSVRSSLN